MSHYTLSMKNETDTILATDLVISDKQMGKRKDDFHWIGVKGHHGQLQIIGSKPEALLPITYQASDGSILVRLKSGNPLLPIMKAIEVQLQGKYDTTDGELQPYLKEPVQVNYDYTMKIKAMYAVLDPQRKCPGTPKTGLPGQADIWLQMRTESLQKGTQYNVLGSSWAPAQ